MTTSENRLSGRVKFSLLIAGLALVAPCGVWYVKVIRQPKAIDLLQELAKKEKEADEISPDPVYLKTLPASDSFRSHLLDGEFTIVNRMQDISQGCRAPFESSFSYYSRTVPKKRKIDFADPGQDFNYGDAVRDGVPFRQLHFAGLGPNSCFIYYQQGGRIYPSTCLAVMDYSGGKVIWVGVVSGGRAARNFRELRAVFSQHKFSDSGGLDC
jgi:hypothetical protein